MTAAAAQAAPRSHLFYQTRLRRPMLDQARGVYIWDVDGKRYLDGSSGAMVANIGHANPRVIAAMHQQLQKSAFGYRLHFENEPAERLAAELAALAPAGLDRVFFTSGGSEAVESCVKLARQWAVATGQTSRRRVISRYPSYHGSTFGALALTGYDPLTEPFAPMLREMPKIPAPTSYLDRDNLSDGQRGERYAELLRAKIEELGPETVLAFIVEPIGGASTGALVPPQGYMERVRAICDEYGVLLIHDEVMTGAGRTGRFFGAEHWPDAAPDVMALSKGMGAGYSPLGAMLCAGRLVEPVLEVGGFQHGYTYAGNPLACAAGLAVTREIVDGDLTGNAARIGAVLKRELEGLMSRYPFIGDVRGKGLLLAFETVADRESMRPLPREMNAHAALVEEAYSRGLIIYSRRTRGGREGDHFMVCPPLITEPAHVDEIVGKLDASLAAFAQANGLPRD